MNSTGYTIGAVVDAAFLLGTTFGVSVAIVVICSWAFEFAFSIRYAVAVWAAWWFVYYCIHAAIPKKIELKGGEEEDD